MPYKAHALLGTIRHIHMPYKAHAVLSIDPQLRSPHTISQKY